MTGVTVKGSGGAIVSEGVRRSSFISRTPMDSQSSPPSGRRPGRPRADEADDVRGKLKESANRCFGLYGYEGASVARIAKGAGVAPTALYHHFGTKESLWEETFLDALSGAYSRIEELMLGRPTLIEALDYFLPQPSHVAVPRDGSREFLIRCAADMRAFPELAKYRHHRSNAQLRVFRGLSEIGYRSGEIHASRDPETVTELLRTIVMGVLWERYTHPDQASERVATINSILPEFLEVLSKPESVTAARRRRKAG